MTAMIDLDLSPERAEELVVRAQEAFETAVDGLRDAVREETLDTPEFLYTGALRAADGALGALEIEVAQLSEQFGPGPFQRSVFHD